MSKPVIILVEPQLPQNIGSIARAMLNFGVNQLRLVRPLADPVSKEARALAAGADQVLEDAKRFQTTEDAIADLHAVYATTARARDMVGLRMAPRQAAEVMALHQREGKATGLLFGPESSGLTNEDVALCTGTISVPLNPHFSSLNLAQAVLLMVYEFYQAEHRDSLPVPSLHQGNSELATKGDLIGFLNHLETELEKAGYFRTAHKRPKMVQSLHTMFSRLPFTAQEVRTLRGVISDLVKRRD